MLKQTTVRIEEDAFETFKATAAAIGTTTSEAIRMFVYAFNRSGGFPDDMKLNLNAVPPSFRQTFTQDELVHHVQRIVGDMDSGRIFTGADVLAAARRVLEQSESATA